MPSYKMEQIEQLSKTDCSIDLNLSFSCAFCKFMTNSTEHLEKHITIMHHDISPKYITKIISLSDNTNTKQADTSSTLTHVDDKAGVNFPERQKDDIQHHSASIIKSEYIDDETKGDSNYLKPHVKDLSNMMSDFIDNFNTFSSSCVKTEMDHNDGDTIFSDINQSPIKQEIILPSLSNCVVKDEIMHTQSCSYTDISLGKLKSLIFTQHPTGAAVVVNYISETDLNILDIRFFCIRETCPFSTILCNVYKQHLLHCCSLHQPMTRIETERLKSTLKFILDFHSRLGVDTIGFQDFLLLFNKIYISNVEQNKISEDLGYGSSSSILNFSNSVVLSDVKSCRSYDDENKNSEGSFSLVPSTILLENSQNTDLSGKVDQKEIMSMAKQDNCSEQLIKTDPYVTHFPSSSKGGLIIIESSIDHIVSNNVELENDIAGKPLYDNNASFSKVGKVSIKDEVNFDTKCNICGKKGNHLMHIGTHDVEKGLKYVECTKSNGGDNVLFTNLGKYEKEWRFKCNECGKGFSQESKLSAHMRLHSGEKSFNSNEHGKSFNKKDNLSTYMILHKGDKPFKCNDCGKSFSNKGNLIRHMKVYMGEKPFKCNEECCKSILYKSSFTKHIKLHTGEKPFKCNVCGKDFHVKCSLISHMRIHTGEKPFQFQCNECGRCFSEKGSLLKHKSVHTGEKPFKCNECGKGFPQKPRLTAHMRLHTGGKPFICNDCGKNFLQKGNLNQHMRIHTGIKPFRCNECGKGFGVKCSLIRHMRVHTGEKPFKCNDCGKCFSEKSNLINHMRVHTGEKPFKCNDCGKRFTEKSGFIKHTRVHTGEKPFRCNYCGKGFSRKRGLIKHMRLHTG